MRRVWTVVILLFLSLLPLFAKGEVFFSNIVNASYLTDFAMGAFPVSFWGEFGIDHIDLFQDLNSKVVVRVEAGMAQRTLRQDPSTGTLITDHNPGADENYSVVFSYGTVGFEQGIVDGGEGKADFLYSDKAAQWVKEKGWDARRFFCVMGRMAAALVMVEEGGNSMARPKDMPEVSKAELELARKHLGSILKASMDNAQVR